MNTQGIFDAITSHAAALGVFDRVSGHEPKNAPGTGLTAAVYFARMAPAQSSGLASTSGVVTFVVRIYNPMTQEPQDGIDPAILTAADSLCGAYAGDFTLGGLVRNVDIRGMAGTPMSSQAGYLTQDGNTYRTVDITLPLIVNDLWAEAP
jgi:hypothetical protein